MSHLTFCTRAFLLTAVAACLSPIVAAQAMDATFKVVCVADRGAAKVIKRQACLNRIPVVSFGDEITLAVEHAPEVSFDDETEPNPATLVLFMEGKALPGARAHVGKSELDEYGVTTTLLTYRITHDVSTETGRANWKDVLVAARQRHILTASTGVEDGAPGISEAEVEFEVIRRGKIVTWFLIALAVAAGFFLVAAKTGALRDSEPDPEESDKDTQKARALKPTERAYSLARVQMAAWTVLVLFAYLYVWLLTAEYKDTIPASALVLMGTSMATVTAAAAVDSSKVKSNREKLEEKKTKKASSEDAETKSLERNTRVCKTESFVRDICTSAEGASLHRLQFIVWTLALMGVFVVTVWNTMAMPDFDATLLGLMGITSGTYVGLKLPENKA